MEQSVAAVQAMLARDFEDLATGLARGDNVVAFGAGEHPPESDRRLGQTLFQEYMTDIRPKLCNNPNISLFIKNNTNPTEVDVITTVLDIVITSLGGVPVLVLTAMILKYSLKRLCSEQSNG